MNDDTNNPLVSVGVLTYNSAKTVVETLESIKAQTYKNLELIISDDASKDNSVELCRKWVEENKDRFVRCEILTVSENTGIPANCNRRLAASNGEWSKGIAADDTMRPDCIENFIKYVKENPDAKVVFAKVRAYYNTFDEENFRYIDDIGGKYFCETFKTNEAQYQALLRKHYGSIPSMFAKLSVLKEVKFDERFKFIEDYPMLLRLSKAGVIFQFMDKEVVNYRRGDTLSGSVNNIRRRLKFVLITEDFRKTYIYPNVKFSEVVVHKLRYLKNKILYAISKLAREDSMAMHKFLLFISNLSAPNKMKEKLFGKKEG